MTAVQKNTNKETQASELLMNNGMMPLTLQETQEFFKKAIDVSTPLIAVSTPDPA